MLLMNKRSIVLCFVFIMSIFGCDPLVDECTIYEIVIEPVELNLKYSGSSEWHYELVDTFVNNIQFKLTTKYDVKTPSESLFSLNLFRPNYCCATTIGLDFKNRIDTGSFALSLNRAFLFNNEEIEENTNLYDNKEMRRDILLREILNEEPVYVIHLSDEFYKLAEFKSGNTTFYFSCITSDNLQLTDSVEVYIAVN